MRHFAWSPNRRGFKFWFPICSAIGIGLGGMISWIAAVDPAGGSALEREYGMPATVLALVLVGMGVTTGILVGALNQRVASRVAATVVGAVAVLPTAVAIGYFKLSQAGKLSSFNLVVGSLFLSVVVGGLYGAILYSPTRRD